MLRKHVFSENKKERNHLKRKMISLEVDREQLKSGLIGQTQGEIVLLDQVSGATSWTLN